MKRALALVTVAALAAAPWWSSSTIAQPLSEGVVVSPGPAPRAMATPVTFDVGSLIIPMDVDYQNAGQLRAFGLLYALLRQDVPVSWCILDGKTLYTGSTQFPASPGNSVDFSASAVDLATSAVITNHGYRGGPFVIDSSVAQAATPIINAWNQGQTNKVTVHKATASFVAPVNRYLLNAPTIGVNNDGNAGIAFGYLNAAGIPDSTGAAWTTSSPDLMTPAQVAGPSLTVPNDGALFGPNGYPVYCQLMSMHWTVDRTAVNDAAIAEMKQFLSYPTHLFAECQAVSMIEDDVNGHFVTSDNGTGEPSSSIACFKTPDDGLCSAQQPTTLTFLQSSLPFAQLDGPFKTVGGSEPAYGWAPGSSYYNTGIVMIRSSTATAPGLQDLWMTGVAGSTCTVSSPVGGARPKQDANCMTLGRVSYLGGHQYTTNVPLTTNPTTQGARLFLNSLFEAGCTTNEGQPSVSLSKSAPPQVTSPQITFTLSWSNVGAGIATHAVVTDVLPAGTSFVSATAGGTLSGNTVSWMLNDLGPSTGGTLSFTVNVTNPGTYQNTASVAYKVGNNAKTLASNQTSTVYCLPLKACPAPDNCGTISDGCGGTLSCGTCTGNQTCGGGGPNVCGTLPCIPLTSCPAPDNCGTISDGCGGTLSCGTCTANQTCGGGGVANVCGCKPLLTCPVGLNCDAYPDGCGGMLNCGTCTGTNTCGGGGKPNVCGCTPLTQCPAPDDCGTLFDGCGGTISCGSCTGANTCGGGGTPNVCGSCVPLVTCPAQDNCGTISDGCGGILTCGGGTCPGSQVCVSNVCTDNGDAGAGDGGASDAGTGADSGTADAGSGTGGSMASGTGGSMASGTGGSMASGTGGSMASGTGGGMGRDGGGTSSSSGGMASGTGGGMGGSQGAGAGIPSNPGKSSGCGCRTANDTNAPRGAGLFALLGAAAWVRRRRARS